ncbi:hypothetical protein G3567_12885 [Psychroflexus sp. YR1-1]|uniref:Lipoprotein n=1 Tax=Psychroflexus aurantiacus TaxID=2709310 RepID=A0A6B3R3P0_9FLAO|nr:hypothetical protein [Psychroflexus aurantiacus]NEV95032.1 hypothetical protein [Psychroflexus aurantiacus]
MRTFIITSIFGFLLFSCSTNKSNEQTSSEPAIENSAVIGNKQSKFKGLSIDPELTGNLEEHRPFESRSELTIIPVESYKYDLDSDGQLDKIELFNFEEYANDPGDFQRIRIELANGKVLDEYNLGIRANNSMPTQNEISSDLISVVKMGNLTFLMTYGWYFASDPTELTVFDFSTGEPRRIFGQNFRTDELVLKDSIILTGYTRLEQAGDSKKPELYELRINDNKLELKISSTDKFSNEKIVFFHLSEQEFDSVANLPDYQGLYEVSSDFGFYVSKVMDSLKNSNVKAEITTERFIDVGNVELDKFEHYGYGAIFIKSDSTLIEVGIMTDMDYYKLISEFFN